MPIRTASVKKRLTANGLALHRAKQGGVAEAASELTEQREALKKEREERRAQALLPKPSALDRLVRTHHPEAKEKKGKKEEGVPAAEAKKPKAVKSRAEKSAAKAAAVEAARRTPKKPAK